MALPNAFLPPSIASYLRLTGTGVGRDSQTVSNQFAFVKMLPEKWASSGSFLATVIVFNLRVALAKGNPVRVLRTL